MKLGGSGTFEILPLSLKERGRLECFHVEKDGKDLSLPDYGFKISSIC